MSSDPWLRWAGPLKGVAYGLATVAIVGHDTFESIDFRILDPVELNVAMFLALPVLFGVAVVIINRVPDRRLERAQDKEQPGYLVIVGLGVIPLMIAVLFFTSSDFCGCDPAY